MESETAAKPNARPFAHPQPNIYIDEPVALREGSLRIGMGIYLRADVGWVGTSWGSEGWAWRPFRWVGSGEPERVPVGFQRALGDYTRAWPSSALEGAYRRWAMLDAPERVGQAVDLLVYVITDPDGWTPEEFEELYREEVELTGESASRQWLREAMEWVRLDHVEKPKDVHEAWEAIRRWYPLASAQTPNPWTLSALKRQHLGHDIDPPVLLPDGETVLVLDDDLGFTLDLDEWTSLGGSAPAPGAP